MDLESLLNELRDFAITCHRDFAIWTNEILLYGPRDFAIWASEISLSCASEISLYGPRDFTIWALRFYYMGLEILLYGPVRFCYMGQRDKALFNLQL